jgi:hypothetical protein
VALTVALGAAAVLDRATAFLIGQLALTVGNALGAPGQPLTRISIACSSSRLADSSWSLTARP